MHAMELRQSKQLQEVKEHVEVEAEELNREPRQPSVGKRKPDEPPETQGTRTRNHPTTLGDALGTGSTGKPPGHPTTLETDDHFIQSIKDGYPNDPMFKLVIDHPEQHVKSFAIRNGIIRTINTKGSQVVCIPRNRELITQILAQAHEVVGHFGGQRTCEYVRRWYWWPRMVTNADLYCKTCETCHQAKVPTHKPTGLLHPLPIPTKPWDSVGTDFIGPFPEANGFNYLWVVIC